VKEHPADIPLTQDTFRSNLEQAIRTIAIEAFAAAYRRWLNQNKMCVCISGDYVQKI
jgi:predicted Zn-dependent peptidase